jgi:hypothetical protein
VIEQQISWPTSTTIPHPQDGGVDPAFLRAAYVGNQRNSHNWKVYLGYAAVRCVQLLPVTRYTLGAVEPCRIGWLLCELTSVVYMVMSPGEGVTMNNNAVHNNNSLYRAVIALWRVLG